MEDATHSRLRQGLSQGPPYDALSSYLSHTASRTPHCLRVSPGIWIDDPRSQLDDFEEEGPSRTPCVRDPDHGRSERVLASGGKRE